MNNNNIKMKSPLSGFVVAAALAATLISCSEKLDYFDNPNALRIEVVDEWKAAEGSTRVAYSDGGIHTEFQEGDAIGVYAFDGKDIKFENVKFTMQSDGSWTGEKSIDYDPNLTYYAYYPYDEYSTYTPTRSNTAADASSVFADFVNDKSNVFWVEDQSTKENFNKSNLMVAKGETTTKPQVKFIMEHQRGLAVIEPTNKWCYSAAPDTKYSMSIVNSKEYVDEASGNYLYLVKPTNNTMTIGGQQAVIIDEGKYQVINGINLTDGDASVSYTYSTSYDNGATWSDFSSAKPAWLTVSSNKETNGQVSFSCNVPILPFPSAENRNAALKNAAPVTDYDLSMHNNDGSARSSRTTANCYLVHAPGTYKLPLVYGNGIKDGVNNVSAYHTSNTSSGIMQDFSTHNGVFIQKGEDRDPWLVTEGHQIKVKEAKLIWQDVKGLISEVGVDGDYLTFTVSSEYIDEGNAVIAVTDTEGRIAWSWHIWVTQETLSGSELTAINTGSHTYEVAPVNIGQHVKYSKALCRVQATCNNITLQFDVATLYNVAGNGTEPYYQWGRKDPECPNTTCYDMEGNTYSLTTSSETAYLFLKAIENPGVHFVSWPNNNYCNFWDNNQTQTSTDGNVSTATLKTVYDPCPPDFCVPTGNLFRYIGDKEGDSQYGIWATTNNKGFVWVKDAPCLFFPASSGRNQDDGSLTNINTYGEYWSATMYGTAYLGFGLTFTINSDWDWWGMSRSNALPIRPVAEK